MYHFFAPTENAQTGHITVTGGDVNHISRVLRLVPGDRIIVADGEQRDSLCEIEEIGSDFVRTRVLEEQVAESECPVKLYLFQGLPKGDKMEWIVEKAVELGASGLFPVEMRRCVVKLEEKKKQSRVERWNKLAESAAKQSGRRIIPPVEAVHSFTQALEAAKKLDVLLVPYEGAEDMCYTRRVLRNLKPGQSAGIFIGPEGGFDITEIDKLKAIGAEIITLGPRILRTETAGMAALAMCTLMLEDRNEAEI